MAHERLLRRWRSWPGHEPARRLAAVVALAAGMTMLVVAFRGFRNATPARISRTHLFNYVYDDVSPWRLWVMAVAVVGAGLLVVLKLWVRRAPGGPGGSGGSASGAAGLGVPAVLGGILLGIFLTGSHGLSVAEESYCSLAVYGVVVLVVGVLLVAPAPWPGGGFGTWWRRCLAVAAAVAVSVPATAVLAGALAGGQDPPPRVPQAVPRSEWPAVEAGEGGSWTVAPQGYVTDMVGTGSGLLVLEEGKEPVQDVGRYRSEEAQQAVEAGDAGEAGQIEPQGEPEEAAGAGTSPTAATQGESGGPGGSGSPAGATDSAGTTDPEDSEDAQGAGGTGQDEEAHLTLFDAQGSVAWRYSLPGAPAGCRPSHVSSCPLVLDPQGRRVLVTYQYDREPEPSSSSDVTVVAVLDVASGDLVWRHEVEDSLYAVALTQGHVAVQTVPRDRLRGSTLSVYSPEGGLVWSREEPRRLLTASSTHLALVPFSNDRGYGFYGRLDLVDATTGEQAGGYDAVEVHSMYVGDISPRLPAGWVARCAAGCSDQDGSGGQPGPEEPAGAAGRRTELVELDTGRTVDIGPYRYDAVVSTAGTHLYLCLPDEPLPEEASGSGGAVPARPQEPYLDLAGGTRSADPPPGGLVDPAYASGGSFTVTGEGPS